MPRCKPMTGMNTPSGLKARMITWHANTSDTKSNDTRQTRTNIYPHGPPRLKAGPDTQLLSQSEGPVGLPLPRLPPMGIHKEEHLLFLFIEVYQCPKNKKKCD